MSKKITMLKSLPCMHTGLPGWPNTNHFIRLHFSCESESLKSEKILSSKCLTLLRPQNMVKITEKGMNRLSSKSSTIMHSLNFITFMVSEKTVVWQR